MSSAEFDWQSLLHTDAPSGSELKAALFTTYDRVDERLLVEHLLPYLLRLEREPDGEGRERQYFLLELDRRLQQLHDRLVIISSTAREEPAEMESAESGTYGWVWSSIRHLTVGSRGNAVQHAKLWLLYWSAADDDGVEYLEIVVSSANLTTAGLKSQLQAAWRACIPLHARPSQARLAKWQVLPEFLRELALATGDKQRLDAFIELLRRADCPEGVTFLASVPGKHSKQVLRRTPWGIAGLRKAKPPGRGTVQIRILAPFVGIWNDNTIKRWCAAFDGSPKRLQLIWIDEHHPWAKYWLLPRATYEMLMDNGSVLLQLRHAFQDIEDSDRFHNEHRSADDRWSHAKLYSLKRGKSSRLLVTSANFSAAAWGITLQNGELRIENFELGVCVNQANWPLGDLQEFNETDNAALVSEIPTSNSAHGIWGQAVWDGKEVAIDCRCDMNQDLVGEVHSGGKLTAIESWVVRDDGWIRSARVPWTDPIGAPSFVELKCGDATLRVVVFDERPQAQREHSLPPDIDKDLAQALRDDLLFEQYGGICADEGEESTEESDTSTTDGLPEEVSPEDKQVSDVDDVEQPSDDETMEGAGQHTDSYAVPAFILARRHLHVVDSWSHRLKLAVKHQTGEFERKLLRDDAKLLIAAFERQAKRDGRHESARAIGAKLAAEELRIRLQHFPEE